MALKYDTDSGQVYFEAICSALSADPPWTYCKTVLGQSENYNYFLPDVLERSREAHRIEFDRRQRPQKGATKLLAICERTCTDNIDSLTLSVLREVPAHLGKRIYDIATNRNLLSLKFWKAFVRAYQPISEVEHEGNFEELSFQSRYIYMAFFSSWRAAFTLNQNVSHTVSQQCDWLSAITIGRSSPDIIDYMSLADLPNLVILQFRNVLSFKEFIIRAWSRRVIESGGRAFPSLRVLCMIHQSTLTDPCLRYFENFPALQVIGFSPHNLRVRHHRDVGCWKLLRPQKSIYLSYQRCTIGAYGKELPQKFSSLGLKDQPILNLYLEGEDSFERDIAYLRLIHQSGANAMAQKDPEKWDRRYDFAVYERWWFRTENTQRATKRRANSMETSVECKKSRRTSRKRTMDLQGTINDVLKQYQTKN